LNLISEVKINGERKASIIEGFKVHSAENGNYNSLIF
jgi:hypothetical protein